MYVTLPRGEGEKDKRGPESVGAECWLQWEFDLKLSECCSQEVNTDDPVVMTQYVTLTLDISILSYACSWSLTTNVFKFYSRVPAYLLKQKPSWGLRSNITWTLIIHRLPIWVFFPYCSIQFANQAFTVVSMHSCISWHADELHNIEFIQWMGLELVCQQIHYRVLQRAAAGWWSIRSPSAAVTCI